MHVRRLTLIAAMGVSLACGAAGLYAASEQGSGGAPPGDRAARVSSIPTDRRLLPLTARAAQVLSHDPVLGGLAWIFADPTGQRSVDEVDPAPSLRFPEGTTHQEALQALYVAIAARGELPEGATLAAPLAPRTLAINEEGGFRLGLTAPFGYTSAGLILPASVALPGHLSPAEVEARWANAGHADEVLPEGAIVHVPRVR